ncbi:MAG: 50S ribosome-binding protein YggL [Psychromonas sp.]
MPEANQVKQVKRSNRLRKKLYVDEYQVLGFEVSFKFESVDEEVFDTFFSDIMDFVDSRELMLGGAGGTDTFTLYVSSYNRYGSVSVEDRAAFEQWLSEKEFISNAEVGALCDAYYED